MNAIPATLAAATDAANRQARESALERLADVAVDVTGLVNYRSAGRLLVIGEDPDAVEQLVHAAPPLTPAALLVGAGRTSMPGCTTWCAGRDEVHLAGWLGAFRLRLDGHGDGEERFDLVLDLTTPSLIERELLPPGYQAPGTDPGSAAAALSELRELVGEFEKPRYFDYDPDICAHGMKGATACRRCIDACPAEAITSLVDRVQVEPFLCQGGGACATACPTGAIAYGYPSVGDTLERVRRLLAAYREAGGESPVLLVHDAEAGAERARGLAEGPGSGHLLPLPVEEVASLGLEAWLSALAYGAGAVRLVDTPAVPERSRREVSHQLAFGRSILSGLGYPPGAVAWLDEAPDPAAPVMPHVRPAVHAAIGGKRQILFAAVDHLSQQAQRAHPPVELPAGAPFGTAAVDEKACTLCMACVTVCPGKALLDGQDVPQLRFLEANCVQCGLCTRSCPEDAIRVSPRFLFDPARRGTPRILCEDSPFHCVSCGTPFATTSVIGRVQQRLTGHAMFQGERERLRLQMCGDCRVADMMRAQEI
jgi:ferredoxin